MGDPFTQASVSNYNVNAPADDGSETASNRVSWATIKTKLGDPLKTAIEDDVSNTDAALAKLIGGAGVLSTSVDYTVLAADQGKLIKVTAADKTITTPAAATVTSPFVFNVVNNSSGDLTLDGNSSETIDGDASITIPAGNGVMVYTDGTNWFTTGQNFTKSFPPPGSYKNLAIKVLTNTTVQLTADYITVTNGSGKYQTLPFDVTINLGTTGAAALDTGTIAIDSEYHIWPIAKADGTTSAVASTSSTSPTLPTGYTYSTRVGAVLTAHASATLHGTWQKGRTVRYILGLAQTTTSRNIAGSTSGSVSTPTWTAKDITGFVPTTASEIIVQLCLSTSNGGAVMAAPNNSYGSISSTTAQPPLMFEDTDTQHAQAFSAVDSWIIESDNVYYASSASSGALNCLGWVDAI